MVCGGSLIPLICASKVNEQTRQIIKDCFLSVRALVEEKN